MRKTLIGIFYLLAALVLGALLADGASRVSWLSWLAYGRSIGLSVSQPMVLDLSVLKVAFGIEVGATVSHVLCLAAAFWAYRATVKKIGLNGSIFSPQDGEKASPGQQDKMEEQHENKTV